MLGAGLPAASHSASVRAFCVQPQRRPSSVRADVISSMEEAHDVLAGALSRYQEPKPAVTVFKKNNSFLSHIFLIERLSLGWEHGDFPVINCLQEPQPLARPCLPFPAPKKAPWVNVDPQHSAPLH